MATLYRFRYGVARLGAIRAEYVDVAVDWTVAVNQKASFATVATEDYVRVLGFGVNIATAQFYPSLAE